MYSLEVKKSDQLIESRFITFPLLNQLKEKLDMDGIYAMCCLSSTVYVESVYLARFFFFFFFLTRSDN